MTQYECTECGAMGRFWREHSPFVTHCPSCEEPTTWARAFGPDGAGVVEF